MGKMWIVAGTWQERHGCDCRFCDRVYAYTEIDLTLTAEDREEALTKALTHYGKDPEVSGKWRRRPMAHQMTEPEKMRAAGVQPFDGFSDLVEQAQPWKPQFSAEDIRRLKTAVEEMDID